MVFAASSERVACSACLCIIVELSLFPAFTAKQESEYASQLPTGSEPAPIIPSFDRDGKWTRPVGNGLHAPHPPYPVNGGPAADPMTHCRSSLLGGRQVIS